MASPAVVRGIGFLSLTAISLNAIIGAGIFALPANVAQLMGLTSPWAYVTAGAAILLITLCFAEAGSLFEQSGGPYLYTRTAFGAFTGFQVGWVFLLTRLTAVAAVSNTFAAYLGYFWPAMAQGAGRVVAITLLIAAIAAIHCAGLKPGVWVINTLTIGKLVPLLVFCAVGLFFVDTHRFSFTTAPAPASLQEASLLLIFAFGGFEIASVPSEEVVNPKRALPPALVISVGLAVVLYLVIQLVAMGTLPGLAGNTTPLASSAATFLGPAGGLLLTIGAIFSTAGNANGSVMIGGRILYAFAQGGQLPAVLGRIHPRFRTPAISLVVYALAAWAIAVSGTFVQLAAVNALGRLLFSAATCLAVPVLRRKMPAVPERFTLPGGAFIPVLGLAVCAWLLIGSTWNQALITAASIVAGVLLYAIFGYSSRNTSSGL